MNLVEEKISRLVERVQRIFLESDIENALNELRKSAETACKILILNHFGEVHGGSVLSGAVNHKGAVQPKPKKLDLANLIVEVCRSEPQSTVIIKDYKERERIKGYLEAIRSHGNPASHDPDARADFVSKYDLDFSKEAYKQLVRWLFDEHLKRPLPEQLRALTVDNEKAENILPITPIVRFEEDLRQWYQKTGYKIDALSVRKADSFLFILKIQERRKEILVLIFGLIGEVKLQHIGDVDALRSYYDCEEAWIVTSTHVSKSVLEKNKNNTFGQILAYNFDEIIEQDLNLRQYFAWVEGEIKKKSIDVRYVPIACERVELDDRTQALLGKDVYAEDEGFTEGYLDSWLADNRKEHVSILGEFGTGKTWLTLHYTWLMIQRYTEAKQKRLPRPRIPILVHLRDFAKSVNVDSLISDFFFRKHQVELKGVFSAFMQLNKMGKILLIFDGFDEMSDKVSKQKMIDNFWELASVIDGNSKVVLTCRSEHFPHIKEGRSLLRAELTQSTKHLTGRSPQFEVLHLKKFDRQQIKRVLGFLATDSIVEKILSNEKIADLLSRPIMVDLIVDAIKEIELDKPIDMSRIYLYAIKNKLNRDIEQTRTFTSLADKVYFMCELSWWMLSNDSLKIHFREFHALTDNLFGYLAESHEVDYWRYDMRAQTILTIDDEDGYYRPAHKSLLEFFSAFRFACSLGVISRDFLEIVQTQSNKSEGEYLKWREYFKRSASKDSNSWNLKPLLDFAPEDFDFLVATVGNSPLTYVDLEILCGMVQTDQNDIQDKLLELLEKCRGRKFEEVAYLAVNICLLLAHNSPDFWCGRDLSKLVMRKLQAPIELFEKDDDKQGHYRPRRAMNFRGTNFSYSDLSWSAVYAAHRISREGSEFEGAIFDNSDLTNTKWEGMQINHLMLSRCGRYILVGCPNSVILLDVEKLMVLSSIGVSGWGMQLEPNSDRLFCSGYGDITILDSSEKLSELGSFDIVPRDNNPEANEPDNVWTTDFAFSSDGSFVAVACANSYVYLLDPHSGTELAALQGFYGAKSVSLAPSNQYLVSAGYNELILWDVAAREVVYFEKGDKESFDSIHARFHPKVSVFAATNRNTLRFIDAQNTSVIAKFDGENYGEICFSTDGRQVAVAAGFGIEIYEYGSVIKKKNSIVIRAESGSPFNFSRCNLMFSGNGEVIFAITDSRRLCKIDVESGTLIDDFVRISGVSKASFVDTKGIPEETLRMLGKNGALINPKQTFDEVIQ